MHPVVAAILAAADEHRGREFSPGLIAALNQLAQVSGDERLPLTLDIAGRLDRVASPAGAGLLAVWLGAAVENEMIDPQQTAPGLARKLLSLSRTLVTSSSDSDPDPEPDSETLIGMEFLGQGLVAHLSRSPEARAQLGRDSCAMTELERTEHLSVGVMWVLSLLHIQSGELLVFHVPSKQGFRVEYQNLSNCFHLFTLLQHALIGKVPDARQTPPEVLAVARDGQQAAAHDEAWWHFGQPVAGEPNLAASVWGEARPDSILRIDGQQVLLLWPMIMGSRGWDAGFFSPFLHAAPPQVSVLEALPADMVDNWWQKLQLASTTAAAQPARPWWKFW